MHANYLFHFSTEEADSYLKSTIEDRFVSEYSQYLDENNYYEIKGAILKYPDNHSEILKFENYFELDDWAGDDLFERAIRLAEECVVDDVCSHLRYGTGDYERVWSKDVELTPEGIVSLMGEVINSKEKSKFYSLKLLSKIALLLYYSENFAPFSTQLDTPYEYRAFDLNYGREVMQNEIEVILFVDIHT